MGTEEDINRGVLRTLAETDNRHDTSAYEQLLSPDVVVHLPDERVLEGVDAYRAFIEGLFEAFPDYNAVAHRRVCEGDTVVHHWSITGTHRETGRRVNYGGASLFLLADAKIVEAWLYPDRATMQRQLSAQ